MMVEVRNDMETPLVSIIIPVYNVENYLDACLESVCNQTYKNIEVILVDDGSTDSSGRMCDDWSKKDDRIKVIHKANGGLSDARNAGLDVATGEYIEGVDSDDAVSPEITEQLMKAVLENNAEIVICDLVHIFPGEQKDFQVGTEMKVFTAEDALCEMMYQKSFLYTFWGKIYKKSLLDGVRFPVGMLYEDVAVMYKIFCKASRIVYFDAKLYGYLHRENSITTKKFSKRDCDILQICQEQVDFAKGYSPKVYDAAIAYQATGAFRIYLNAPDTEEYQTYIDESTVIIKQYGRDVLKNQNVRLKTKVAILLFYISKRLLKVIYAHVDRWK